MAREVKYNEHDDDDDDICPVTRITYLTNSLIDFIKLKYYGGYETHEQCSKWQSHCNSPERHKTDSPRKFARMRWYQLRISIHYRFWHQKRVSENL